MLRYAVQKAADGSLITFDPALNGKSIEIDKSAPANHIKIATRITIAGPGAGLLTIDGGNATRIFFTSAESVHVSGVTLANGSARGGDGIAGSGGAGGGGGAAGLGGAVFLNSGSLTLTDVVFTGNHCTGGNGGGGGSGFGAGRGGRGGGFAGDRRGSNGDLASNDTIEGAGGEGGKSQAYAEPGNEGGWAGGGGGGGYNTNPSGGRGAPGGPSGFAGGVGGAGGFMDAEEGNVLAAGGGYGGSALGGAIFVRSGHLQLRDTIFLNNGAAGGLGGSGAPNGIAKGGALFVCSSSFCGPGHDGVAVALGRTIFKSSSAPEAGDDPACPGRDDADVCGYIAIAPAETETKH
jgi:hypothetical protein